jgi:hypothetical protein
MDLEPLTSMYSTKHSCFRSSTVCIGGKMAEICMVLVKSTKLEQSTSITNYINSKVRCFFFAMVTPRRAFAWEEITIRSEYRVNSKKPPHLCGKFAKPPLFGKFAKNHRFCENLLQCALIQVFSRLNTISDIGSHCPSDVADLR